LPEDENLQGAGEVQKPARPPRRKPTPQPADRGITDPEMTKGAGAAGIGGGTLIAILASALPDGTLKSVLIWLAPTATITVSALWIWARKQIVSYFDDKEAERVFAAARKAISQALSNSDLTPQQRADFQAKQVELDQMIVDRRMSKATTHAKR
jgi:hypothetical protein